MDQQQSTTQPSDSIEKDTQKSQLVNNIDKKNYNSIIGFSLGIILLFINIIGLLNLAGFTLLIFASLVLTPCSIIFSILGLKNHKPQKTLSIIGLILGIGGILIFVYVFLLLLLHSGVA